MVKEKSGVYVDIRVKENCMKVYDRNGNEISTVRFFNPAWEVSDVPKGK